MKKFIKLVFCFFCMCLLQSSDALAISCAFQPPRTREQIVDDNYKASDVIGVFEVVEVGEPVSSQLCCWYKTSITLRPIEIIKGKVESSTLRHVYDSPQQISPFKVKQRWLMALGGPSGPCSSTLRVNLDHRKDADFYKSAFKSIVRKSKSH